MFLWNEKDWLKKQYPSNGKRIEQFIDKSTYIKIVGDIANTIKHRELTKKHRSSVAQTGYLGRVTTGQGATRRLIFFSSDGKHIEIMEILRGAIEEFTQLKRSL